MGFLMLHPDTGPRDKLWDEVSKSNSIPTCFATSTNLSTILTLSSLSSASSSAKESWSMHGSVSVSLETLFGGKKETCESMGQLGMALGDQETPWQVTYGRNWKL